MGDLSSEPSMEEILSSIKRIIAEEGDATPGRGRRAGRAAPPVPADDEVLELSDPMPRDRAPSPERVAAHERPADAIRPEPARPADKPRVAPRSVEPVAEERPAPSRVDEAPEADVRAPAAPADAPTVSSDTVEATRGALDQLSRLLVKPEPGADGTLEGLVREMLRPMLRDWLDAHLPALAEGMVAREIDRIMSTRR